MENENKTPNYAQSTVEALNQLNKAMRELMSAFQVLENRVSHLEIKMHQAEA